ncbi:Piwi domain-containing protein [Thamnocephalis sphaerospora]|uniref:Piwi domain-containing protein n=1 Tax=Thamnocephalis sphaerospora TaxID=78915 RepID=A0A4P9XPR2_9FUNG|nr:Piwi domain-containing protein [Thamnocephalis sphaerospora]|eukprot:RKP07872.1 Piwi domain-containing protein [Thamnocephalis sphaerospora]
MRDQRALINITTWKNTLWAVLVFADRLRSNEVERFVSELANVCHRTGMNVVAKNPPIEFANRQSNTEDRLKLAFMSAKKKFRKDAQIVVCIVPDATVPLYAEIKRVGETVIGIPTQCIVAKHVGRPNYCANVCLKMNAKLGGINVVLTRDQIPFIAEKPTIIIGADVSHPAPGDERRPSIATLVGSMDVNVARFCSVVRIQHGRTESINDLRDMVMDALKAFFRNSGHKPARILFYRDGISEGEFERVINTEVKAVKLACQQLEANYNPTLTYVAVQKRHHTRFFPMGRDQSDRSGNCMPGTVVDSGITHPYEFDFFLQSHAGIQGTSRPAHYQVLHDENKFTSDALQDLTYRLCYLYARCTRAVGVIPCIYYADLLALRVRYHAQGDSFSEEISLYSGGSAPSYANLHSNLQNCMFYM